MVVLRCACDEVMAGLRGNRVLLMLEMVCGINIYLHTPRSCAIILLLYTCNIDFKVRSTSISPECICFDMTV
jgi:hypothetical protein